MPTMRANTPAAKMPSLQRQVQLLQRNWTLGEVLPKEESTKGRQSTAETYGTTYQKAEADVTGNHHKNQYMNCLAIAAKSFCVLHSALIVKLKYQSLIYTV